MGRRKRGAVLDDCALVITICIGSRIELAIQWEDISRCMQYQRVRTSRNQVDSVVVDHVQRAEIGEYTLKIRTDLEPVECPLEVRRGHIVTAVKFHAFAQIKPYGSIVQTFVAGRQPVLEGEILGPANQRVERHVR